MPEVATVDDGFQLLEEDHREVERLFSRYADSRDDVVAHDICSMLAEHSEIEDAALYPALRRLVDGGDDLADVAEQEHTAIASLIARVYDAPPGDLGGV